MIGIILSLASEFIEVRVSGNEVLFRTASTGGFFYPINNLHFPKDEVIKQFPDLKNREDWNEEAHIRLKEKVKNYETEEKKIMYVVKELRPKGYVPMTIQKTGFRPKKYDLEDDKL